MIVLDTNVVSELIRAEPNRAVLSWVDGRPTAVVTAITVAELRYGVTRLPDGARKRALDESVTRVLENQLTGRVLAFDATAAAHFGEIMADSERAGHRLPLADAQIAAICRRHGATLATHNVKDFAGTSVELVDPWTDLTPG